MVKFKLKIVRFRKKNLYTSKSLTKRETNETNIWYCYKKISIKWLFCRKRKKNELNANNRT